MILNSRPIFHAHLALDKTQTFLFMRKAVSLLNINLIKKRTTNVIKLNYQWFLGVLGFCILLGFSILNYKNYQELKTSTNHISKTLNKVIIALSPSPILTSQAKQLVVFPHDAHPYLCDELRID